MTERMRLSPNQKKSQAKGRETVDTDLSPIGTTRRFMKSNTAGKAPATVNSVSNQQRDFVEPQ
jgi:hypothetical protein